MKCVKSMYIENKAVLTLACALGLAFVISGCSSSSSSSPAAPTTPTTVTVSGTVTTEETNPEPNVTVTAKYSDTDTEPAATTDTAGKYSLTVSNSKAVWLNFAKAGLATLNSEKSTLTTNIADADVDMPTAAQAQQLIDAVFGINSQPLGNVAWLVVDVENGNGNDLGGVSISSTPGPDAEVYVDCNNADSLGNVTIVCPPNTQEVMYIAYFTGAPVDASVSAVGDTKTAPLRQGEITFVDFEQ